MLITNDVLTDEMLRLKESTVNRLENFSGLKLHVIVDSQTEEKVLERYYLKRVARLFFHSTEHPSLYCVTYLNRSALTEEEYLLLMAGREPIGRLFARLNAGIPIYKRNITVNISQQQQVLDALSSGDSSCYKKKYDYWIGHRKIGEVIEYFTRESLVRT
jgi:chorismate-pyruvate lyase